MQETDNEDLSIEERIKSKVAALDKKLSTNKLGYPKHVYAENYALEAYRDVLQMIQKITKQQN